METGISKIYEMSGSKGGITVKITVTEAYDLAANTSDVQVAVSVKSSAYYNYTYYLSGSLKVNGVTLVTMDSATPTHYVAPGSLDTYYKVRAKDGYTGSPWSLAGISHLTDGSKTVTVELNLKGYTSGGGGGSGWSVADSREITLTHIPRASTIGAADAYIGAVSTVSVVRRSTAYTHTVAYSFGSLSGYLDAAGSHSDTAVKLTQSSIPFTLPAAFYEEIPNAKSGVCTLTCKTYSGTTQIGDAQSCTFTATAKKALCAPQVSGTVVDTNAETVALTGDENKLVRFMSAARCTITATAKNGATIAKKTIGGTTVSGTVRTITQPETGTVAFTATDSRGYKSTATAEAELVPYVKLTVNAVAKRTDPTSGNAVLTVTGNCYNGSFGLLDNTLSLRCSVNGTDITLETEQQENTYTASCPLSGLDYTTSHTLTVTAEDALSSVSKTVTLGRGIPVFDWGEEDFCFHVPVAVPELTVGGMSLAAYIQSLIEGS